LLMLYAAAAALSRDRHGRRITLAAAWLGIAYQLGSLPVVIPMARDYAAASAPLLAELVAAQLPSPAAPAGDATSGTEGAGEQPQPEAVIALMRKVFVGVPIGTAVLWVAGSLLLIFYFGGRRGRALYGLLPDRAATPD